MTKGKRKGGAFERLICKMLSMWWTKNNRDDVFGRTNTSGAYSTIRSKKGLKTYGQAGDICAVDPIGCLLTNTITFELKNGYPTVSALDVLDTTNKTFVGWLDKAIFNAKQSGTTYWALIHRRTSRKIIIYIPEELYLKLSHDLSFTCSFSFYVFYDEYYHRIYGFEFGEFLKNVEPSVFNFMNER